MHHAHAHTCVHTHVFIGHFVLLVQCFGLLVFRKRMPPSLVPVFGDANKRADLFRMWMQHAQDFSQVVLQISRDVKQRSAQSTTQSWSRTQLEQTGRYSQEDITNLIERLTRENQFIDDPNFPGVERYRRYFVVDEISQRQRDSQEDRQRLSSTGTLTRGEALELTSGGQSIKQPVLKQTIFIAFKIHSNLFTVQPIWT